MQKLTRREKEVFNLLLEGAVPKEIAGKLKISYDTVVSHQKKLYRKLGVHSVDELTEKYQDRKNEIIAPNGNGKHSVIKRFIQPKYLIAAGIASVFLLFILIGVNLAGGAKNSFDPPRIYLEDGTYFTIHTYDEVYLRATRWAIIPNEIHGETYSTNNQIRLNDIYSGSIANLFPIPTNNNLFRIKISGTIDKECKNLFLDFQYVPPNNGTWINIAFAATDQIGPGDFSIILSPMYTGADINALPEGGYVVLGLYYTLFNIDLVHHHSFDTGERIPAHMPDSAIWATINNLKIEPLDRLAK